MTCVERPPADPIAAALREVRGRIVAACDRSGRDADQVRLVAVSKTQPAEIVTRAAAAGQTLFGENRVQEALAKQQQVAHAIEWHLIGALQRNKARHAVGAFSLLHGVGDERLLIEIDRRAAAAGLRQAVLLQVRLGGERSKAGVDPADLPALVERALVLPAIDRSGLMTIPPPVAESGEARRWFAGLHDLREAQASRTGAPLTELSMGMSADFEVAVEEGATLVRVGTAIFGGRGFAS